ncbi:MAG: NTPase [Deltaproteobacteria bacterium]|nr:NTPase [Deltaproteobacteria bacterium]MCK5710824.1 NTPase [Deltaproteobacteria bacterium]
METAKKNILISGLPGIGKTSLIKKICQELKDSGPIGFYTEEIRNEGQRKGFQLIGLNGHRTIFAHVLIESNYHVGKYRVDINAFDEFLESIDFKHKKSSLIIIDEIGKMECLSSKFIKMIWDILDSSNRVIATISHTDGGIKGKIKQREDVELFKMNLDNRDSLLTDILEIVNTSN